MEKEDDFSAILYVFDFVNFLNENVYTKQFYDGVSFVH